MPAYNPVTSQSISYVINLGMRCSDCCALVQESDKWLHDQWHARLATGLVPVLGSFESDSDMLRRLLREVMELSERLEVE